MQMLWPCWRGVTLIPLLHLVREKLVVNKEDVGQIICLVNVAKKILCLRGSFATLNGHKLVVRQVKADDGHGLLHTPLVLFQHFGIRVGRWSLFGSIYNVSKVHGSQNHFHLKLPKAESLSVKHVHVCNLFIFNMCHLLFKECVCTLKIFKPYIYVKKNLRHSSHSNNIYLTSNMPYTLKYLKSYFLHLKHVLQSQIDQLKSFTPQKKC